MNDVRVPVIVLLSFVLFTMAVQPVFAPYHGARFDKDSYAPGDSGTCTVEIWMAAEDPTRDKYPLRYTKAELTFSFGKYSWTGELVLNPDDSTHKTVTIDFSIPQGTSDGEYSGEVRLTRYFQDRGTWKGPEEYTTNAGKITVKGTMIPGFPWESIIAGILIGTVAIFLRKTAKLQNIKSF